MTVDISKFSRFSMSNCLTVRMDKFSKKRFKNIDRTYTAHLMTPDLFIQKAHPGKHIMVPFKDYWPHAKYIKKYIIPRKIKTFIISTFNEIFHPNYTFGDSVRYTVPRDYRKHVLNHPDAIMRGTKCVGFISINEYERQLRALKSKVASLWDAPVKILLLYDHSRAPNNIQKRAELFNDLARDTLQWTTIAVKEQKPSYNRTWQHYSTETYIDIFRQIVIAENRRAIK